jgi:hypothetical protein
MRPRAKKQSLCGLELWTILGLIGVCGSFSGCHTPLVRTQSPDISDVHIVDTLGEEADDDYDTVGDLAFSSGMNWVKVEAVGLVTKLDNTGSDPPPSPQRAALIGEMQSHETDKPSRWLASPTTSMAIVYGYLKPGIRKGEKFDLAIRAPSSSDTTSLESGWLMQTRLREVAVLNNTVHSGLVIGLARGDILVNSMFEDEKLGDVRGRILGGGVSLQDRPLGLNVRDGFNSVKTSSMIGSAINARFHVFESGSPSGVAIPKRDNYIELSVPPRYKHNIHRYMKVVRSIPLGQSPSSRADRLQLLQRKLMEPTTSEKAAMQLEAIGKAAIPMLKAGLISPDPMVRFLAAEALAYLDDESAAEVLAESARTEFAFRWRALTAMAAMDHVHAVDELHGLLDEPSVETRYGAFVAMRHRNSRAPFVRGEVLNGKFSYHTLPSSAQPLIHFTRSQRPEVTVFGSSIRFKPPAYLFAGKKIMLKTGSNGGIKVTRFEPGQEDREQVCEPNLDSVIRTVAKLGANYADILALVHQARSDGYIDARVEVNAMPRAGRAYQPGTNKGADEPETSSVRVTNPIPEMFFNRLGEPGAEGDEASNKRETPVIREDSTESDEGIFGRMKGLFN